MGLWDRFRTNVIQKVIAERKRRMMLWTILFFLIYLAILALHFVPDRTNWEAGTVARQDIQADRYLTFVDEQATLARQQEALADFQDSYKVDLERFNTNTIASISEAFSKLEDVALQSEEEMTTVDKIAQLRQEFDFSLGAEDWATLVNLSEADIQWLYERGSNYAIHVMSQGVPQAELENAREKILQSVRSDAYITGAQESFLLAVLESVPLYPTYVLDAETTAARRAEILATVEPETVVVQRGELVVSKGEILTERQSSILQQLGYSQSTSAGAVVLGLALMVAFFMLLCRGFLKKVTPEIYQEEKLVVLLMLLTAGTLALFELFLALTLSSVTERAEQVGYLIPVAMGSMLITILLDVRLGMLINAILSVLVGLYTDSAAFALVAFAGGLVGALGVSSLGQRSDISRTALYISAINACMILALGLLKNQSPDVILFGVAFGVANGLLSSIFTMGVLPYLENLFGITTSIRLLELANPNQPLLKRLMTEAPGTYHHCVMVGNLGEAAAEAIGADGLLVRVGAYYHDIGKLRRPLFFSENQFSGVNPHDNITPQLSTLIITSHVKDGVEMAKQAKLPPVLIQMIAQHHGDSLVAYFYYKAKTTDPFVREQDFRYPQSKPQTKEAAILMMADTVEAAVRSKKDATHGQIEGFIRKLIKDKLNDGQFDECELTFRDLDQVAAAFVRVTNGVYHKRIEYPSDPMIKRPDPDAPEDLLAVEAKPDKQKKEEPKQA